jgi:enterochelin esterase family protein
MSAETLAIDRLLADAPPDEAALAAFLERHEFPLNEGRSTTFVFRGEADKVLLRHWIWGLPGTLPFRRVPETDLWFLIEELPSGSRIEYKLEVVQNGGRELIRDPLNPHLAHDPFGSNSVLHGPDYETPDWTLEDPEARPGQLVALQLDSAQLGGARDLQVYLPPRLRKSQRYPLLVVHDGPDYLEYSSLKTVLDNLIYRHEVAPMIAALTRSPDRLVEYAADPRHAGFVVEELVPALEARLPIDPRPEARGLMGASFGAVAALSTAWMHPGKFGRLLLQSGSFAFTDIGESQRGEVFEPVVDFMNRFRDEPGRPAEKVFLSCGQYESLIYENRSLVPRLQETGMRVRWVESRDGHNWENWRDRLREGLSFLFPGPLWMVYE